MIEPLNDDGSTPAKRPEDIDDTGDFADEHSSTSVDDEDAQRSGEPESPHGASGLEPTNRPN